MGKEAIILAGGLGTRLRSILSDTPKPMAPVNGMSAVPTRFSGGRFFFCSRPPEKRLSSQSVVLQDFAPRHLGSPSGWKTTHPPGA